MAEEGTGQTGDAGRTGRAERPALTQRLTVIAIDALAPGDGAQYAADMDGAVTLAPKEGFTDRLVTTSRQQARQLERSNPRIRSVPLPTDFEWPTMPVNMIWHQRTHNSKPHRWLRLQLREFLSAVAEEPLDNDAVKTTLGALGQGAR